MLTGKELGSAIEAARLVKGVSKKKLADDFSVKPPSIQGWVNHGRIDKAKLMQLIAYFSDVVPLEHWGLDERLFRSLSIQGDTPEEDKTTLEPGPPIAGPWRAIPIVGTAQMGTEGYWHALDSADGYIEFPSRDRGAYALKLKGDSMAPAIKSGWIAVCEPSHRLIPLEYVMIRLNDGESMVKELLRATDEEVTVQSVNDAYGRRTIPVEQIETIHYVSAIVAPSKVIV